MLFNTLDTLKRKMVMMIIFFLFTGLTMFVIPVSYIPVLGKAFGFCLLCLSILTILDFLGSKILGIDESINAKRGEELP